MGGFRAWRGWARVVTVLGAAFLVFGLVWSTMWLLKSAMTERVSPTCWRGRAGCREEVAVHRRGPGRPLFRSIREGCLYRGWSMSEDIIAGE
jgi:hypothetical protein